jgi:hypothetical protein
MNPTSYKQSIDPLFTCVTWFWASGDVIDRKWRHQTISLLRFSISVQWMFRVYRVSFRSYGRFQSSIMAIFRIRTPWCVSKRKLRRWSIVWPRFLFVFNTCFSSIKLISTVIRVFFMSSYWWNVDSNCYGRYRQKMLSQVDRTTIVFSSCSTDVFHLSLTVLTLYSLFQLSKTAKCQYRLLGGVQDWKWRHHSISWLKFSIDRPLLLIFSF